MQPYLFPYIGYFQLINAADKFVIYDDVDFIKQGWINRNAILCNKERLVFTVPLVKVSSFALINETEIALEQYRHWRTKFLKTLEQQYREAIYFEEVFPRIQKVLEAELKYISELALLSIRAVIQYLDLGTEIKDSSSEYGNSDLTGPERVIDICMREKATTYINPTGGRELYSLSDFEAKGIKLKFIETSELSYLQFDHSFVPNLSIIDVLMFNKKEEIKNLLQQFTLS